MVYEVIDEGDEFDVKAFIKAAEVALMHAALPLQRALSTAPPKAPGAKHLAGPLPGGFYTNRQRRFVLAAIADDRIKVPYLRTGNLPRSWSISRPEWEKNMLVVYIYSDPGEAPYNEWVQQDEKGASRKQVPWQTDWPTPGKVWASNRKAVEKELAAVMKKWGVK